MNGLTLIQRYYRINEALNLFLQSRGIIAPVLKYGIDPATQKANSNEQTEKYPYFQSFLLNPKPQSWTSQRGGIYTTFEYQLSFFTSPRSETEDDEKLMNVFETARIAFSDVNLGVLKHVYKDEEDNDVYTTFADVLDIKTMYDFKVVSGSIVPKGVLLVKMAAVTGYPGTYPNPTEATNIDEAITITNS